MTTERIQLHSGFGRLIFLFVSGWFWFYVVDVVFIWSLSIYRHDSGPANFLLPLQTVGTFFLSRWARRNATGVFATSAGLELTKPPAIIPWRSVAKVQYLPQLSNVMRVCRIHFANHVPTLTFYASEEVDQVVARFKSAAEAAA